MHCREQYAQGPHVREKIELMHGAFWLGSSDEDKY